MSDQPLIAAPWLVSFRAAVSGSFGQAPVATAVLIASFVLAAPGVLLEALQATVLDADLAWVTIMTSVALLLLALSLRAVTLKTVGYRPLTPAEQEHLQQATLTHYSRADASVLSPSPGQLELLSSKCRWHASAWVSTWCRMPRPQRATFVFLDDPEGIGLRQNLGGRPPRAIASFPGFQVSGQVLIRHVGTVRCLALTDGYRGPGSVEQLSASAVP